MKCDVGKFTLEYPDTWKLYHAYRGALANSPGAVPSSIAGPIDALKTHGRQAYLDFDCFKGCGVPSAGVYTPKGLRWIMVGDGDRFTQFSNHEIMFGNEPAEQLFSYSTQQGNESPFSKHIFVIHDMIGLAIAVGELGPGAKDIKSESDWKYKAELDHIIRSFKFY